MAHAAIAAETTDSEPSRFSFDGFGTLGLVHSSEDSADFRGNVIQEEGAGHSASWSAAVDSLVGLQLTAQLSPTLTGVVQVISEQRYDGGFAPRVEWANVKLQVSPELELRVGRTVLNSFLVSEYRKVGFVNPWVRPPLELYGIVPVSSSDGVDMRYRLRTGSIAHTFQMNYGGNELYLPGKTRVKGEGIWSVTDRIQLGSLSLHLGYQQARYTVTAFDPLFDAFRPFGPEGVAIAQRHQVRRSKVRFGSVGVTYDPGDWFAMGEWGHFDSNSALGKRAAWYLSAGYRWDRWTPYVVHARTTSHSRGDTGLTLSNYPPELAGAVLGLNQALSALLASTPEQDASSLGVRWDFRTNAALKLQYDRAQLGAGNPGLLWNQQPDFEPGGRYDLISVTLDFVF